MKGKMSQTRRGFGALALAAVVLSALPAVAGAHHGWSSYDEKKLLEFTGTIQESGYENPHGFVKLDVEGTVWTVILAPPSRMTSRGLTREMLKPGATAKVEGYPHRSQQGEMRAERITIDGKTTELR
jgi:hypothetical protein